MPEPDPDSCLGTMEFAWDFAKFWDGLCWGCTGSDEFNKTDVLSAEQYAHLDRLFESLSGGEAKVSPAAMAKFMKRYYARYVMDMSDPESARFLEVEQEGFSLAVCNRRAAFEDFVSAELVALDEQGTKVVRGPTADGTISYFCEMANDQSENRSELVTRDLRSEFCRRHAKVGRAARRWFTIVDRSDGRARA